MNCTKHKAGQLDIESISSLLGTVDQETVGFLGFVGMSSQRVELADWRRLVPKQSQGFGNLFDAEGTTAKLPPHRLFDHAIDLKEGALAP
jgi:hypothetical protein